MNKAIMIAATGSGCGKTTITCALLKALKDSGVNVAAFKCGPDYIDPIFHSTMLGVPSKNLDLFFTDREKTRELFFLDNNSDISVVEGVMGLYDGISPDSDEASSYDLARALDIPVILLVDAKGMGRSLLAVIKGFLDMDRDSRIKAVIFNRMSPSYFATMKGIVEKETGLTVLGYFPYDERVSLESRYLGLTLPEESDGIKEKLKIAADSLKESVDIEKLNELCADLSAEGKDISAKNVYGISERWKDKGINIAVARDEAFCFYYEDNLRMLEAAGAKLVYFSPLKDVKIPDNAAGIILGGGYPENFLTQLSQNVSMLESIREALNKGMPSLAECGGFMYLHDYIYDKEGNPYKMLGAIKGECRYTGHLVRFGYVEAEDKAGSFITADKRKIKGHEFHYYDSSNNGDSCTETKRSGKIWEAGHLSDNHFWAYIHLYYPSNPIMLETFMERCHDYIRG